MTTTHWQAPTKPSQFENSLLDWIGSAKKGDKLVYLIDKPFTGGRAAEIRRAATMATGGGSCSLVARPLVPCKGDQKAERDWEYMMERR